MGCEIDSVTPKKDIGTLHRYFFWADRMHEHFKSALKDFDLISNNQMPEGQFLLKIMDKTQHELPHKEKVLLAFSEVLLYMSNFYSLLYVVSKRLDRPRTLKKTSG
mgnify:CR=1 FL=1